MTMKKYIVFDNLIEGVQLISPDFKYLYVNDSVATHGKTTKEALLNHSMTEIYPGIENTAIFQVIQTCMVEKLPSRLVNEFKFPDGSTGWFDLSVQRVPEGVLIMSFDISEQIKAELALKNINIRLESKVKERTLELQQKNFALERALDEVENRAHQNEVLMRELHHRIKNNLQLVISLINIYSAKINDQQILEALNDCQNNIKAMALVHQNLYKRDNFSEVDLADYLGSLCDFYMTYTSDGTVINIERQMEHIPVKIDDAITLGLIVNELLTNSFKHAFPKDRKKGTITLRLEEDKTGKIIFHYSDNGKGFPENFKIEQSEGFGLDMIQSMIEQIEGTFKILPHIGASFEIIFQHSNKKLQIA